MVKLLNISSGDEMGGRWNGFDYIDSLKALGYESKLGCFWNKTSKSMNSFQLFPGDATRLAAEITRGFEILSGRQSTFQFWSKKLLNTPEFVEADVVHLQVVNDHFLSLETIAAAIEAKPTVWTWHDFWPITGHCIFPGDCERLQQGCGNCPQLSEPLSVVWDRTDQERLRKEKLFSSLKLNIHVTTKWMEEKIGSFISDWDAKVTQFPFGIDTNLYQPRDGQTARKKLGLAPDDFVIFARATDDKRKQFLPLVNVLDRLSVEHPEIVLLTVQGQGLIGANSKSLRSIEFPWTNDQENLIELMAASNLFAMPSTAETFGMMALEAMSCGVPVLHTAETATAEIVGEPALALRQYFLKQDAERVIEWAISNPQKLRKLAREARARAEAEFTLEKYLENLTKLYEEVQVDYAK